MAPQLASIFYLPADRDYSRATGTETSDAFEQLMAGLEGGHALAFASGMAAAHVVLNRLHAGATLAIPVDPYHGVKGLAVEAEQQGRWKILRIELDDTQGWIDAAMVADLLWLETPANPLMTVCDIPAICSAPRKDGTIVAVDSTFATPLVQRPLDFGADVVMHSATKFIGGHGTSIGGVLIDGGTFDYAASGRFPGFTEPDPSYHGLAYFPALGHGAFIIKARVQLLRDLGCATTPFNSFMFLQGLETLSLRMERHWSNANAVAAHLDGHAGVSEVLHSSLASSPWHERANELGGGKGYGSVLAFVLEGGIEAGKKFVEALELHSHVANIGDVRSLCIHPASTTHSQLNETEQLASGVQPGLVRLSVGLESIDDILADIEKGFAAI